MNSLAKQFFSKTKDSPFLNVRILTEERDFSWDEMNHVAFDLPRAWFELSRIDPVDRVEFTRDFWLDKLPYHPRAHPRFFEFFEKIDDVAVVLLQRVQEEPMDAELVYSFQDNSSFFRGKPPITESGLELLKDAVETSLPRDYLSFLSIHNGFGKLSEMGLLEAEEIPEKKRKIFDMLMESDRRIRSLDRDVDPGSLIPFYEAIGLSSYQCFYQDWYPGSEMGNIYLSGIDYTLSDLAQKDLWEQNLAFASFSEWLSRYLQGMMVCT